MGLQDILAFSTLFSEARGDGDEKENGGDPRASKKARLDAAADGRARSITSFFGQQGAVAE